MKQYRLTANKTKMTKLLREFGFAPTGTAQLSKGFRSRTWWLEWFDETGYYRATLSTAAGKAFLGIRFFDSIGTPEQWISHTLDWDVLDKFNLMEEIKDESETNCRS